jgi:hypothetical protein
MLPFKPETVEEMKNRFAPVLATLFSIEAIEQGKCKRPGEIRDFIFDFRDGMRLIVSREHLEKTCHLHVSASMTPESKLTYISVPALRNDIIYRLKQIHDIEYEIEDVFMTKPSGVVHLLLKDIC